MANLVGICEGLRMNDIQLILFVYLHNDLCAVLASKLKSFIVIVVYFILYYYYYSNML